MSPLNKYLIKVTDRFDPEYFASINEEIDAVNTKTGTFPASFRAEILVSFLRNHSIRNDWGNANPELMALVTSGSLFAGNIEALFASSKNNPGFQTELESYLMKRFSESQSAR